MRERARDREKIRTNESDDAHAKEEMRRKFQILVELCQNLDFVITKRRSTHTHRHETNSTTITNNSSEDIMF